MDINDFAFGNGVVTPEQQRAIAGSLRSRDNMGAIMALTGDRAAAPVGQEYMKSAGVQRQQGINHGYYQGMLRQQEAGRLDRAKEHADELKLGYAKLGAMRDIAASKQNQYDPLPKDMREGLLTTGQSLRAAQQLDGTFKDEWHSSIPGANALQNTLAGIAPDFATDSMKEYYTWRQKFVNQLESIQRHKLYGGALTETEVQYWKQQALRPGASPKQVHEYFKTMQEHLAMDAQARLAGGSQRYNPQEMMGYLNLDPATAPSQEQDTPAQQQALYEIVTE